jgi:hypothetical protein
MVLVSPCHFIISSALMCAHAGREEAAASFTQLMLLSTQLTPKSSNKPALFRLTQGYVKIAFLTH